MLDYGKPIDIHLVMYNGFVFCSLIPVSCVEKEYAGDKFIASIPPETVWQTSIVCTIIKVGK